MKDPDDGPDECALIEYDELEAMAEGYHERAVLSEKKLRIATSYLVTYASSTAGENLAKKALREMEEVK